MTVQIEEMKEEHLAVLAKLECECFSHPWSEQGLRDSMQNPDCHFLTASVNGEIAGYIGSYFILDEADITNVAVFEKWRNQGIGRSLLAKLEEKALQAGISGITLEVRVSNERAIHLYESLGYESAGVRKGYYDSPKEDGMIMWKKISLLPEEHY